jgi:hypothetical protein
VARTSFLSDVSREILEREREAAAGRVEQLEHESAALRVLGAHVEEELDKARCTLRDTEELLGLAPQVPLEALNGELRGRRLRELAVSLLRERRGEEAEIHYREWLELLQAAGVRVGGKDPAATFLAQISAAPEIESVQPRSGRYRLKTS